jgi:copper resistance protein D
VSIGVWDLSAVLVKAVLYAATLGATGGVYFLAYSRSLLERDDRLAIARLLMILAVAAIVASAARVLVTAGSMSEDAAGMMDPRLLTLVWRGGEGRAAAIRVGGLLLLGSTLARHRSPGWVAISGAIAAATSFAWVGHTHAAALAGAAPAAAASVAAPWLVGLHLLAAAFWLGALSPLLIHARRGATRQLGALAARFGRVAIAGVGALLAAGIAVLWILLGHVSELWNSAYGRLACTKIALVACLLALAALNKLRLVPRIIAGDTAVVRRLRESIGAEMIVAMLILLVTAALTTLAGPPGMV